MATKNLRLPRMTYGSSVSKQTAHTERILNELVPIQTMEAVFGVTAIAAIDEQAVEAARQDITGESDAQSRDRCLQCLCELVRH